MDQSVALQLLTEKKQNLLTGTVDSGTESHRA